MSLNRRIIRHIRKIDVEHQLSVSVNTMRNKIIVYCNDKDSFKVLSLLHDDLENIGCSVSTEGNSIEVDFERRTTH